MKHDENLPTDPELEARIVAWVLGEASAFEAAELERRLTEQPSLAVFKRRIEAVHGLVREASRPPTAQRRLSPERRAKLLATIGVAPEAEPPASTPAVESMYPLLGKQPRWKLPLWAYSAAACLLVGLFVAFEVTGDRPFRDLKSQPSHGFLLKNPDSTATSVSSQSTSAVMQGVVETSVRGEMVTTKMERRAKERAAADVAERPVDYAAIRDGAASQEPKLLDQVRQKAIGSEDKTQRWSAPALTFSQSAAPASPPAQTTHYYGSGAVTPADKDGLLNAAPAKTEGSGNTLDAISTAGSVTLDAASNVVVGGNLASEAKVSPSNSFGSVAGFVSGGTGSVNEGHLSPRAEEEVITLSPFAVRADRDAGYAAANTLAGTRVANRLGDVESSLNRTLKEQFGGKTDASESDKLASADAEAAAPLADAPVAHPPVAIDETLRTEAATKKEAISTFSLHVSDVSFRLAQAALNRGEKPDAGSIRPEEFYNAFDYGDPAPVKGEAVACRIEQSAHPFLPQRNLVRIAMKVPASGRGANQPLRLTVLLDTSGSMEREDRVASVRHAFASLATLLGPSDRITLIGFARQPRLLADAVFGDRAAALNDIIARTPAEGGTNLEEALKLAGEKARAQYDAAAQNRIVLLTDGAANLGSADPAQLAKQIAALRQQGLAFDACGIGIEGLDDSILEALTRQGDGRYYVINSPEEADASFARKLAGAFRPAAENVKVQVRFNPSRVQAYRLIGFEQHRLRTEDFRNDKVDAAELAAEEDAVALYQVEIRPEGEGELGDVFVRFRTPGSGAMVERSWTLPYNPQAPSFDRASPSLQLAGTAAFLAEKLRGGGLAAQIQLRDFAPIVNRLRGNYAHDARVQEFVTMFGQARRVVNE